jgi:hypothetical protein
MSPPAAPSVTPDITPAALISDLIASLPVSLAMILFTAAVLRKAVRNEFSGPAGLSFGRDEINLLSVYGCLLAIFALPVGFVAWVLDTFVFARIASSPEELSAILADTEKFNNALDGVLGQGGLLALNVLIFAVAVFGIVAWIRFAMVNAATVGERRIVFLQTWNWSKGNVLRVLAALLMTNLPAMLAAVILGEILFAIVTGGAAAPSAPMAMVGAALIGFVSAVLSIPSIALGAELYKGLRPPAFVAK